MVGFAKSATTEVGVTKGVVVVCSILREGDEPIGGIV